MIYDGFGPYGGPHNAPEAQFFEVSAACPLCGKAGASYHSPVGCSCSGAGPGRWPPGKGSPMKSPLHESRSCGGLPA